MKYHKNARTNLHLRKLINESNESIAALAARFNLNPKTLVKWKKREELFDHSNRPKTIHRTFEKWQERVIVKVRKHLKLSLDDLVSTLQRYLPQINRVNCYRVLARYNLNILPKPFRGKGKFGEYLPGFLHLDLAYLPLLPNSFQRQYLLVAIDRVTKLVFVSMVPGKTQKQAMRFLQALNRFYPYRVHYLLTDNGKEFAKQFTLEVQRQGGKHRRTKVKHPWTNGQAETTIKRIKTETVWKTYYPDYQALALDLNNWQNYYNLETKLRSIGGLTPAEKVLQYYQGLTEEKRRQRFLRKPSKEKIIVHTTIL